ncbi:hypothetical protein KPL70_026045 [Citrus sinensis]|nr:hypothetical protein KPL70_026045 [Citrus sinensis]
MNALFCALDKKEFHRVSSCESANEIWHKLEVVYEGKNQVKEYKLSRYTRQYELFQMEQNESVYSMYMRFTDIINTLGALGKVLLNSEKVKKIIRSLPKEWRPKRTAIEEAKNLNTLPHDDLIGSLISYEEDLAAEKRHEEKKKSIALKALKYESDGESETNNKKLAMLARRFRKFFKKTGERRNFRNFKNQREKKEVIICYECKKPDHIRLECPLINKLKKKAMVGTWDDSEEDSSDDEESQEVSNLALMTIGGDDDLNEVSNPTYDELYDAFKELHNELMKIASPKLKMVETYLLEITQKEKKELITCYECKKLGHIRSECPLLDKLKKKVMVAIWDDSEKETSDDEEHQEMKNLALMAIGEESLDELDKGHHGHFTMNERSDSKTDITFELKTVENLRRIIKGKISLLYVQYYSHVWYYPCYCSRRCSHIRNDDMTFTDDVVLTDEVS